MYIRGLTLRGVDYLQLLLSSASIRTLRNCSISPLAESVLANFPY